MRSARPVGGPCCAASTSCTTIAGLPSSAPRSTACSAVDQDAVAAPVGTQRLLRSRGLGGTQVRDDVAAAERVDRLLRVADQDHRRASAECPVDHLAIARDRCPGTRRPSRWASAGACATRRGSPRRPALAPTGSAGRRSSGCRAGACASPVRRERDWRTDAHRWPASRVAGRGAATRSPGLPTTSRASFSASGYVSAGSSRCCPKWAR